jgi:hypothetical protein
LVVIDIIVLAEEIITRDNVNEMTTLKTICINSHPLYGLQCCGISISGSWLIMNNVITCMVYNTALELKCDGYDCGTCSLQVSRLQSELS